MEREVLARMLEEGLSQSEIGRRLGRHPSTIGYWCAKHGLEPARTRHRARGAIAEDVLRALVDRDLTTREIALELGRSPSTVRHWLGRYGLRTSDAARQRTGRYARRQTADCPVHGSTHHIHHRDGRVSCARCRADAVTRWRQRAKRSLVEEAGGACVLCGYARCVAALEFHHIDPSAKRFALAGQGLARSLGTLREEAAKCVLLCSNCHAEVEAGVATLP